MKTMWTHVAFIFVTLMSFSSPAAAETQIHEIQTDCLIRIQGKIFDTKPCNLNTETGGVINFGHLDEKNSAGYWAYLIDNKDGTYDAYWNEEYGAPRAHARLGTLERLQHMDADCFSGDEVLLCRNIRSDEPIFIVEYQEKPTAKRVLLAFVGGLEYLLTHPNWGDDTPFEVLGSADFDSDGRKDVLVSVANGGNCCPDRISVASYRGDGFFTFLDDEPIAGGWGGFEVVEQRDVSIIRIHDVPLGVGNTKIQRAQRDYTYVDGNIKLIAERSENSVNSQVISISLDDVLASDGKNKELRFDVNQDGEEDRISCKYWERWGVLNCIGTISGSAANLQMQCGSIIISPSVFGSSRAHKLLCDGEIIEY